ncbi:Cyclic di-GMP phosphodiesterase response regulator RpfG [Pelotomaculum schinkii]|uniref:Cyclic di-GMP phosphodiesterase response regulator RpfG n=1 Tax=Pelotomaculum schinkii TaxID=78350 RepID=A0A4Y7R9R8_9FIRM|nr:diguanylate cyclase [Pelotomaculum schinkii]TEB05390.1 Cyclic di-GMP phosphodiesterase response regulator RpfG [Pelotomaculum schinkii]
MLNSRSKLFSFKDIDNMGKNQKYRDLFEAEKNVLNDALQNISSGEYKDNSLLPHYRQLALNYKKLLKLSDKVISISDRQQWGLKQVESALKDLLDNAGQGFLTFGQDLRIDREYSAECRRIFNANIENANILDLLRAPDDEEQNILFANVFNGVFQAADETTKISYLKRLKKKIRINNRYIAIEYKLIKHFEQESEKEAVMLILSDVTDKHAAEEKINYLSYHDKLTGLFNRAYVDNFLYELHDEQQLPLSLIMADLNGLKLTNDVFGHVTGDKLLKNIAAVFQECCRQSDVVARWGGDEFIIILPATNRESCESVCQTIRLTCQKAEADPIELSVALGTATLHSFKDDMLEWFRQAESKMYQDKLTERENNRRRIIRALEKKLWRIEHENEEHCQRIASMVDKLAEQLNLSPDDKRDLHQMAFLHDIGKGVIPLEILEKPLSLTEEEWEMMKKHCDVGYRMAQAINEPKLAEAILSHHEYFNGMGYPQGRKGEEVPLIARIMAVVDAYDAMTNNRPYKKSIGSEEALAELVKLSGTQFDPQIVDLFVKMVRNAGD